MIPVSRLTKLLKLRIVRGNYVATEQSARKREHMPMLEHTEAIGIMMFVLFPTLLSFIGTLIYYIMVIYK